MSQPHSGASQSLPGLLKKAGVDFTCEDPLDDVSLSGITDDSRRIGPGILFVAVKGATHDGHDFVAQAVDAGATAVVLSNARFIDTRVPCLVVPDIHQALARLAATISGLSTIQQHNGLRIVGVTGTNGKTTTCHLIRNILRSAGRQTAMLGTVGYDLIGRRIPAPWTTPPALPLAEYLFEAHGHGAEYVVMEVSSHALTQRRTGAVEFAAAVFTNLSGDHLDYHHDKESYLRAKKMLFDQLPRTGNAVINADDPVAGRLTADCLAHVTTYGIERQADVTARGVEVDIRGTRFVMVTQGQEVSVSLPLIGRHNISNALAAAATALTLGIDWPTIAGALHDSENIPGRLQQAGPNGHPLSVFVDYAHTDDALRNVLAALKPLTQGRLWCVFGCGGDRDRSKRPRMARVAAQYADRVVVTSDNPRSEDPQDIINDILAGFGGRLEKVDVERDRLRAIHLALHNAANDDVVLIAGKGHEEYQLIGNRILHFSDVEVVEQFFDAGPSVDVTACAGEPIERGTG